MQRGDLAKNWAQDAKMREMKWKQKAKRGKYEEMINEVRGKGKTWPMCVFVMLSR